jgi:hypothetical protein
MGSKVRCPRRYVRDGSGRYVRTEMPGEAMHSSARWFRKKESRKCNGGVKTKAVGACLSLRRCEHSETTNPHSWGIPGGITIPEDESDETEYQVLSWLKLENGASKKVLGTIHGLREGEVSSANLLNHMLYAARLEQ